MVTRERAASVPNNQRILVYTPKPIVREKSRIRIAKQHAFAKPILNSRYVYDEIDWD